VEQDDPLAVIDAMYAACFAGDIEAALAHCAPDAMWHSVTPSPLPGSTPARTYFEMLPQFMAERPGYAILEQDRHVHGDLVVAYVRTTLGRGTMTFRVAGGLVSDVWVINAEGRNTTDFF
jgi:ketosteroid isomerase-like protein